jgi:Family of unknown function (DUF6885)
MSSSSLEITLLAGARALLAAHAQELPQRDDLCGAFCGALALRAAGVDAADGTPLDQDAVALAAGSVVSAHPDPEQLPFEERGRRDYRLMPPQVPDGSLSGTTAAGLVRAIEQLAAGRLLAIPLCGSWSSETLAGLFETMADCERPASLLANLATRQLWGSRASAAQLLDYLLEGRDDLPGPDWDVGHFACVVGQLRGPRGVLYGIADTYPSLGSGGFHLQPQERLALALARPGMAPGGMIAVVHPGDASRVRARANELGLSERVWDNGSISAEMLA